MNGLTSIALEKSDQVCFMAVHLVIRSILNFTSIALEKSDQVCFMGVHLVIRSILKFYLNTSRKIGSSLFRGNTASNKEYFKIFPF